MRRAHQCWLQVGGLSQCLGAFWVGWQSMLHGFGQGTLQRDAPHAASLHPGGGGGQGVGRHLAVATHRGWGAVLAVVSGCSRGVGIPRDCGRGFTRPGSLSTVWAPPSVAWEWRGRGARWYSEKVVRYGTVGKERTAPRGRSWGTRSRGAADWVRSALCVSKLQLLRSKCTGLGLGGL